MNLHTSLLLVVCLSMACACGSSAGESTAAKTKAKSTSNGESVSSTSRPGTDPAAALDRRSATSQTARDRATAPRASGDPSALKAARAAHRAKTSLGAQGLQAIKPRPTAPTGGAQPKIVPSGVKVPSRHMRLPSAVPVVPTPGVDPEPAAPTWDAETRAQLTRRCQKHADSKLKPEARKRVCKCFVAAYQRKYTRAQFDAMRKRSLGSGPMANKLAASVATIMGRCLAKTSKRTRP